MVNNTCSVLMAVYGGDDPKYFCDALESILNQTVRPNEIVVVVDGPIGKKIETILNNFKKYLKIVRLPMNCGVGNARNEGLKACSNELVAIMDPDDIAVPNRLELQLAAFQENKKLSVVGGQIAEFQKNTKNITGVRKVPLDIADIRKFAKKRSPFNNVTVMYKKSEVLAVGGYPNLNRAEDYWLFAKMLAKKKMVKNLPDVLVYVRTSEAELERKKSWQHTKEMIYARRQIKKLGVINSWDLFVTSVAQIIVFLAPKKLVRSIYKNLLRTKK